MNFLERTILYALFILTLVILLAALGVTITVDYVILFMLAFLFGAMIAYAVMYGFPRSA